MKKFVVMIMIIATIMCMVGCSEKEVSLNDEEIVKRFCEMGRTTLVSYEGYDFNIHRDHYELYYYIAIDDYTNSERMYVEDAEFVRTMVFEEYGIDEFLLK